MIHNPVPFGSILVMAEEPLDQFTTCPYCGAPLEMRLATVVSEADLFPYEVLEIYCPESECPGAFVEDAVFADAG